MVDSTVSFSGENAAIFSVLPVFLAFLRNNAHHVWMITADQLVQQALDALKADEFAKAKTLLKQAASQAPLRPDIKELLTYAIEQEAVGGGNLSNSARTKATGQMGRNSTSGRSARLMVLTAIVIGVLIIVVSLAAFIVPRLMRDETEGKGEAVITPSPALSPDPDPFVEKRKQLAAQYKKQKDDQKYDTALETLGEILKTEPPDRRQWLDEVARVHYFKGLIAVAKDKRDDAIEAFQKAVETAPEGLDPEKVPYAFHLGYYLYRRASLDRRGSAQQSDLQTALEQLESAKETNPDHLKTLETLALVHIKLGNRTEGTEYYKAIMEKAPGSSEADKAEQALRSMGAI